MGAAPPDSSSKDTKLPDGLIGSLLVAFILGAIGGFTAVLVTGSGKLERWSEDDKSIDLGFLDQVIVGAVAAVFVTCTRPPDGSWLTLVGAALGAGVGGQALLLAIVQGKRADTAAQDATQAQQQTEQVKAVAEAHLKLMATTAQNAIGPKTGAPVQAAAVAPPAAPSGPSAPAAAIDGQLDAALLALSRASRRTRRRAAMGTFPPGGGTVWNRMRTILQQVFQTQDVTDVSLKDLGVTDGTRALLANEIAKTWPTLKPQVTPADILDDYTIDELTGLVLDRGAK